MAPGGAPQELNLFSVASFRLLKQHHVVLENLKTFCDGRNLLLN